MSTQEENIPAEVLLKVPEFYSRIGWKTQSPASIRHVLSCHHKFWFEVIFENKSFWFPHKTGCTYKCLNFSVCGWQKEHQQEIQTEREEKKKKKLELKEEEEKKKGRTKIFEREMGSTS